MDISIVIPLLNEAESLPELHAWIKKVMDEHGFTYEILFIDDGSKDNSWEIIAGLAAQNPSVVGIRFRRNYGKSAALNVGFARTKGRVVFTMDADLQDSPDELPGLYHRIIDEKFHLISGWKKKRFDPITKTIPTKLFNYATRMMSGIKLHDFNCGLKAYSSEVVKNVEVYGEMHRYIPVIAKWEGYNRIGEQVVQHRARKYGSSKFGWNRFINGFLDLLSIYFMSRFGKKPMHFFGLLGVLSFLLGLTLAVYLGVDKLLHVMRNEAAPLVADSPYFHIGLVSMVIGVQLFLAGFLGELVSRNSADRN
ncbi:MAG: glycosyltransferase family 2 protein, partial [Bacteroidota bacterium]